MDPTPQTYLHPGTGATLVRGVRTATIRYRAQIETVELPGWYPAGDPSADQGGHNGVDLRVSYRALNAMRARPAS